MAKDTYHDAVRRALEKEGWTITNEQYYLAIGEVDFEIDLFAERLFAAERKGKKLPLK